MTPGLSKGIRCHVYYDHTFFSKLANHQIWTSAGRAYIVWDVSLVIAYGHFNLPLGLCVGMYGLTYSHYHPKRSQDIYIIYVLRSLGDDKMTTPTTPG